MVKTIPASMLRNHLFDTLNAMSSKQKFLVITKKNRPVSVLVDLDFFEDLLALHSPDYLKSIRQAREDYKHDRMLTHQEVFGKL